MRILFDAKDLINIVEHSEPMALGDFADWLSVAASQIGSPCF
jgi:hypothetical protein